uniref:BED-type domain-containing protein n=1 Tax=Romanomermis culicivorax TaxID=13658 RepID=A0A915K4J0_ROMCU
MLKSHKACSGEKTRRISSTLKNVRMRSGDQVAVDEERLLDKIMDSLIWNYFTISRDDESKVHCNTCQKLISRGGKDRHGWGHKGISNHRNASSSYFLAQLK